MKNISSPRFPKPQSGNSRRIRRRSDFLARLAGVVMVAQGDAKARNHADLLELSLTETQIANGKRWAGDFKPQPSATTLLPVLRSGPTAVSGASREKQTPDSK